MNRLTSGIMPRLGVGMVSVALLTALVWPSLKGTAQDGTPAAAQHKHESNSPEAHKDLAAQVRELHAKVAKLEAALKQGHQGTPSAKPGMGGKAGMPMGMMGGMQGKGMMGMGGMEGMDRDKMMQRMQQMMDGMQGMMQQMMGGMQGKGMGEMAGMEGMGGMGMKDDDMDMMGMMGMGSMGQGGMKAMKGMGKMQKTAALPGFPGASHIYHIGATGFFLDHPEHLTLSTEQQAKLNKAKQKAVTDKATFQRKIDEAEQELWELTGADEPAASKIQAKVQEIEKLRGEQRLAFIRAVGDAAKVLTDEQRKALLGVAAPHAHQHPATSPQ